MQVDTMGIFDFSKAFDKVPHRRLAVNMGLELTWIESFLQNRSQLVVADGHYSSPITVSSGVPFRKVQFLVPQFSFCTSMT